MTEEKNGTVVLDITTTMTETGQMYVVMPVPASVRAAITPMHQPPEWTLRAGAAPGGRGGPPGFGGVPAPTEDVATPRRADGTPDLTGSWGRAPNPISGSGSRRCAPTQVVGGGINPQIGCQGGGENF
jgi:hypothetical protein